MTEMFGIKEWLILYNDNKGYDNVTKFIALSVLKNLIYNRLMKWE